MKKQHKHANIYFCGLILGIFIACASSVPNTDTEAPKPSEKETTALYYTGSGGSEMRLAILVLQSQGLNENQAYLPTMVQGVLVANMSKYSAITVLDRVSLDKVIAETLDPTYEDNLDIVSLGHVTQVGYMMTGRIIRTSTGYSLQINVTDTAPSANTIASYSGTCTVDQLDDQSAIQKASLELLTRMGVQLTERAKNELNETNSQQFINAQTALARGITAQRQGTEVAALSYYFQAAAFDPYLLEAVNRSSILNTNISSGNIGSDVRNDIQWRRDWVARLTETEDSFYKMINAMDPPYTLFYSTNIEMGAINYQTENANLNILINLHGNGVWFRSVQRTLQAVYDGLNATGRKSDWGLANWPQQGLSNTNPFTSEKQYNISVAFELINDQNKVIGRQTSSLRAAFRFTRANDEKRIVIEHADNTFNTVTFNSVKADDISDSLTIRIASVNGAAPQSARFPIMAVSGPLRIEKGFFSEDLTSVIIPDSVTYISEEAFYGNRLTSITIPNSVTSIGKKAFFYNRLTIVTIPDSVTYIDEDAFKGNDLTSITIGANVTFSRRGVSGMGNTDTHGYFANFDRCYEKNTRKAGTYIFDGRNWNYREQDGSWKILY